MTYTAFCGPMAGEKSDSGLTAPCLLLCPGKRKSSRSASMRSSKTNSWVSTNATLPRVSGKSSMASTQGSASHQTNKLMNFLLGGKRKWGDKAGLLFTTLKALLNLPRAEWDRCGAVTDCKGSLQILQPVVWNQAFLWVLMSAKNYYYGVLQRDFKWFQTVPCHHIICSFEWAPSSTVEVSVLSHLYLIVWETYPG